MTFSLSFSFLIQKLFLYRNRFIVPKLMDLLVNNELPVQLVEHSIRKLATQTIFAVAKDVLEPADSFAFCICSQFKWILVFGGCFVISLLLLDKWYICIGLRLNNLLNRRYLGWALLILKHVGTYDPSSSVPGRQWLNLIQVCLLLMIIALKLVWLLLFCFNQFEILPTLLLSLQHSFNFGNKYLFIIL